MTEQGGFIKAPELVRWDEARISRGVMGHGRWVEDAVREMAGDWVADQGWTLVGVPTIVRVEAVEWFQGVALTFWALVEMQVIKP